jgi:hypothetical protein
MCPVHLCSLMCTLMLECLPSLGFVTFDWLLSRALCICFRIMFPPPPPAYPAPGFQSGASVGAVPPFEIHRPVVGQRSRSEHSRQDLTVALLQLVGERCLLVQSFLLLLLRLLQASGVSRLQCSTQLSLLLIRLCLLLRVSGSGVPIKVLPLVVGLRATSLLPVSGIPVSLLSWHQPPPPVSVSLAVVAGAATAVAVIQLALILVPWTSLHLLILFWSRSTMLMLRVRPHLAPSSS